MDSGGSDWATNVVKAVMQEYSEASLLLNSPVTGNVVLQLDQHTVFKALSPGNETLSKQEQSLTDFLRTTCGDAYQSVFIPMTPTTIGGHVGFTSPCFDSTLLDLVLDSSIDHVAVDTRCTSAIDEVFARLKRLGQLTNGPRESRFPEELRLTIKHIISEIEVPDVKRFEVLQMVAERLERFLPPESTWCTRDNSLENIALLDDQWLLFDPFPLLELTPRYTENIAPLNPPFKGHVFLDYAKLLISLEREAGKLDRASADPDHPAICTDRRARLIPSDQIERRNLLRRLQRAYEQRAETDVGRAALHLGYAIWYGLYAICPCEQCTYWGIKESMKAGLERAINQLLADDLATRLSDTDEFSPIFGGTQPCLLYEIPFKGQRAVLKVETTLPIQDPLHTDSAGEVKRNLAGYQTMPGTFCPAIFDSGEYEQLPFLLMQHAGVSLREILTAPFDQPLLNTLIGQLREAYTATARRDPKAVREFYMFMLDRLAENLTRHIQPKHSFATDEAETIVSALRGISNDVLPEWCFWTTTDFTVDNLFYDGERFIFIDPKEAMLGLFEIDLGMFPTLIDIYSRSPGHGSSPVDTSNVGAYRRETDRLAAEIRGAKEAADCQPFLRLGEAWQCTLSCRFREGGEARDVYTRTVAILKEVAGDLGVAS